MPLVTIQMVEGRTLEQKRMMVKDITDAIVKNIGCPPDAVNIAIIEGKRENFGKSGKLLSD
jgi:4-oxalocrotonate tautomerase